MRKHYYFFIAFILMNLFSCNEKKTSLKLLKVEEHSSSKIRDSSLLKILKIKYNLDLDIEYTLSEDFALDQLSNKKTDLVIIPNNATSKDMSIKSIIPLLPRVLMIMTNKNVKERSLKDILENGEVFFEDRSRLDSLFFDKLFYSFNIDKSKIDSKLGLADLKRNEKSDSLKIYIGLIHLNNAEMRDLISQNWSFFSLDDVDSFGKGSKVEGFTLMNRSVKPFIIPKSIIKGKPDNSVLTVSISDILISRSEIDNDIIYGITKTLYENRSRLIQMNSVYNLLDFNYGRQDLSFPLHEGTNNYLEREKPSIWMHYINMAWPILSILVIFIGGFTAFNRKWKKKNKESIENYYISLLDIREKSLLYTEKLKIEELLSEIKILRSKAIKALANNKFDSDKSFNIFLALYSEIKDDLVENLNEIKKK